MLEITKDNFEAEVTASQTPVALDFWAPWCGPCRALAPVLDEVMAQLGDSVVVGKVNVDEQPELAATYGVVSIPTMILFKGGAAVAKQVGLVDKATLTNFLQG